MVDEPRGLLNDVEERFLIFKFYSTPSITHFAADKIFYSYLAHSSIEFLEVLL
jgi:hypothetical protein